MAYLSDNTLLISHTSKQIYRYNDNEFSIIKPNVGSILSRFDKNTSDVKSYVVVNTFIKNKGRNKGIVDIVRLYPILSLNNRTVKYIKKDNPYILTLTNHGDWWTRDLENIYEFNWNMYNNDQVLTSSPISSLISSPISTPILMHKNTESSLFQSASWPTDYMTSNDMTSISINNSNNSINSSINNNIDNNT
jgi:hypothetical protein